MEASERVKPYSFNVFITIGISAFVVGISLLNPARSDAWLGYIGLFLIGTLITILYARKQWQLFDSKGNFTEGMNLWWGLITFAAIRLITLLVFSYYGSLSSFENREFTLLAPVAETFFFQGALFGLFDLAFYSWQSSTAFIFKSTPSAAAFAYYHTFSKKLTQPMLVLLFSVGTLFNYAYWRTRSLNVPFYGHLLNNALG